MNNSSLKNKSGILCGALKELQDKNYFPIVGHSAYYCCIQLMKHIWLYVMNKTEADLKQECKNRQTGSHEVLIRDIGIFIMSKSTTDFQKFNSNIGQLKDLRIKADYNDVDFLYHDSNKSIMLSNELVPILKKY